MTQNFIVTRKKRVKITYDEQDLACYVVKHTDTTMQVVVELRPGPLRDLLVKETNGEK